MVTHPRSWHCWSQHPATPSRGRRLHAAGRGSSSSTSEHLQGPQWLPGFFRLSRPVCEVIAHVRRLSFLSALGWLSIAFRGFQPATKQLRRPFDVTVISTKGATYSLEGMIVPRRSAEMNYQRVSRTAWCQCWLGGPHTCFFVVLQSSTFTDVPGRRYPYLHTNSWTNT